MTMDLHQAKIFARALEKKKGLIEKLQYEDSLLKYCRYVWPVVEPAIPFEEGWAIEAIADHLQAVTDGYIRRLLINVPPGFTKSLMTDVFWPSWEWGPRNMPTLRYVCASYSNHLTERDNMRCRNIVISDRYRNMWGDRYKISNEQFTKIKFANDKTGWKLATSVGGIGVGERGDRFIIDDANNTMEMESEQVRYSTNMWFTEVVPDRLNSLKDSCIIVIQQRLHEEDVSGVALARDMGYVHLCIPMEYVPCMHVNGFDFDAMGRLTVKTFLGDEIDEIGDFPGQQGPKPGDCFWEDPRTEDGQLAWEGRFPQEVCEQIKNDKGAYAWTGQYQQDPEPRGGAILKRAYWQPWTEPRYPNLEFIIGSLDTAFTEKQENDASALTIWGLFRDEAGNPKVILMHAWQERMEFHALVQRVIDTCTKDQRLLGHPRFAVDKLLIEGKASGISIAQEISRMMRGSGNFGVEIIDPKKFGDKEARAHGVEHLFADGMIYAPNKAWADMVINQCAIFPKGSKDDLVDTVTMAMRWLRDCGFALRREEQAMMAEDEMTYRERSGPLYPC